MSVAAIMAQVDAERDRDLEHSEMAEAAAVVVEDREEEEEEEDSARAELNNKEVGGDEEAHTTAAEGEPKKKQAKADTGTPEHTAQDGATPPAREREEQVESTAEREAHEKAERRRKKRKKQHHAKRDGDDDDDEHGEARHDVREVEIYYPAERGCRYAPPLPLFSPLPYTTATAVTEQCEGCGERDEIRLSRAAADAHTSTACAAERSVAVH
jgi:hypothetical protein